MRTISQLGPLQSDEALEITLQINIKVGAGYRVYTSRDLGLAGAGRILSFGGVSASRNFNNTGTAGSTSIELDDSDSTLKVLQQTRELLGSEVKIFIYCPENAGAPSQIFEGRISDPITWDEGKRSLSFDITPIIGVKQIGYAATEADVNINQQVAIGKGWPTVFGKAALVECPLIQIVPETVLTKPIQMGYSNAKGVGTVYKILEKATNGAIKKMEMNIESNLKTITKTDTDENALNLLDEKKLYVEDSKAFPRGEITLNINGVLFKGSFGTDGDKNTFTITRSNVPYYEGITCIARPANDDDAKNPKVIWVSQKHSDYVGKHFILNGTINGSIEYFDNICVRQEGRKLWFKYPFDRRFLVAAGILSGKYDPAMDGTTELNHALPKAGFKFDSVLPIHPTGLIVDNIGEFILDMKQRCDQRKIRELDKDEKGVYSAITASLDLLAELKQAFWSAEAGSRVWVWNSEVKDTYVCNTAPVESIKSVYACRTNEEGKRVFVPVPKTYYTKTLNKKTTIRNGPTNVAIIEMVRPLIDYQNQNWERDSLWCTVESKVSSNTAEQIKYLLTNFCTLPVDSSTFTDVAEKIANYPSNFAISGPKDAYEMATEMAWQSRCALLVDDEKVKIKYLSEQNSPSFIVTDETTDYESLRIFFTDDSQIQTSFTGTYRRSYAPEEFDKEQKLTYSNNADKYGVRPQEWSFYIYNNPYCVLKTLKFWGYRNSNVWKLVECSTFPNYLSSQLYDDFALQFSNNVLGDSSANAVLEGYDFNIENNELRMKFWLPTKAGTIVEDDYAYIDDSNDNIDNFTLNPASLYDEEHDYIVNTNKNKFHELDEVVREMRKMQGAALVLAKITDIDEADPRKLTVDIYGNGKYKDATETGVLVYDINPQYQAHIDAWIMIERGQDGVFFLRDLDRTIEYGELRGSLADETATIRLRKDSDKGDLTAYNEDLDDSEEDIPVNNILAGYNGYQGKRRYPVFTDTAGNNVAIIPPAVTIIKIVSRIDSGPSYNAKRMNLSSTESELDDVIATNYYEVAGMDIALTTDKVPIYFLAVQTGYDTTANKETYIFTGIQFADCPTEE